MINSMTGYGRAEGECDGKHITIELRAVNSRYLDCNVRTGRLYTFLEESIKAKISRCCVRGKIDVYVTIDTAKANNIEIFLNETAADGYWEAAGQLSRRYGLENDLRLSQLMRMPDVFTAQRPDIDNDAILAAVSGLTDRLLRDFCEMRRREGEQLTRDILARCTAVEQLTNDIEARSPVTVQAYRDKIEARMKELLSEADFDDARVIAEAAIFADRIAVNEEVVRLRSHLCQLRAMLEKGGAAGRKLDFLIQELNREANTVGSKSNDAELTAMVVNLKAEIEKMREQAQNIE
jgi:uncharacterized protein (TIGR00255 family)